ncbi:hypothetical protein BGZ83_009938 [Gryganskiella cystojenkinii]|nr:hypothetical protein BGZ83_009938 [Gryganskiella cystojenkinii]
MDKDHGPPAELQQGTSNVDHDSYDGLLDEDWLDMDKPVEHDAVSYSILADTTTNDQSVPSLSLSKPLSVSIPSAAAEDDNRPPGSVSSTVSSESEYSLLNPSADQSRKNSLSSISGFHTLTPRISRTDSDSSPAISEHDHSTGDPDDVLGLPVITSPSFSDFVQVEDSDRGSDHQDDRLEPTSFSTTDINTATASDEDNTSQDGSSKNESTEVNNLPIRSDTTASTATVTTSESIPRAPATSSPSLQRRTMYRTTVEDARTSSEDDERQSTGYSSSIRAQRTEVNTTFRSASTSTMPGSLNLGLDAEIPEFTSTNDNTAPAPPVEERQCRICLGGADEEDTLGRLISPCLCKGSMKYVHVECLNAWRERSPKRESHYKCDTCKYSFSFRRTSMARYLAHPISTFILTLIAFAGVVFAAGFAMKLLLYLTMDGSHEFTVDLDDFDDDQLKQLRSEFVVLKTPKTLRAVFKIDKSHMVFGSFFVSIIGFLQLLLSTILMGGGGGVFRIGGFGLGGRRHGARGERQREGGIGGIVLMIALVFGLFKSVYMTYQFVNRMSRRVLAKAELMVLEVQ